MSKLFLSFFVKILKNISKPENYIKLLFFVKTFYIIYFLWWAWLELNQRPIGYEPTALTPELQARSLEVKMAEGMRFELTVPVMVHSLSRGAL